MMPRLSAATVKAPMNILRKILRGGLVSTAVLYFSIQGCSQSSDSRLGGAREERSAFIFVLVFVFISALSLVDFSDSAMVVLGSLDPGMAARSLR